MKQQQKELAEIAVVGKYIVLGICLNWPFKLPENDVNMLQGLKMLKWV